MRASRSLFILAILLSFSHRSVDAVQLPQELIITPEKSNYQNTSTYKDVMNFITAIKQRSDLVHVEIMANSTEGKDVPLVVIADPKVTTPEEARASGKPVFYLQGNIHGGEVEGKEALMLIMRDILMGDKKYLLSDQILLFAPIYNADGNDKMSEDSRRSQEGSPKEAGSRHNGQDLDLNRDGVKMEAFETRGLIQNVVLKWDPELFVDLHTTNGSWHGYALTYSPSYHTIGHPETSSYTMDEMLPAITKLIDDKYGIKMYLYGGFRLREGWPPTSWMTYNHHPRYLTNQFGLRNRMAILSETFAHDPFYRRINSAYVFATEIIEYTNRHGREMARINQNAEEETVAGILSGAGTARKGLRFKMVPLENAFTLRAYKQIAFTDSAGRTRYARSGKIVEVPNVQNYSRFEPAIERTVPRGYLIPGELSGIADILARHGAKLEVLNGSAQAAGEEFTVQEFNRSDREFEGHNMVRLEGTFKPETRVFPSGTYKVDLAQPLASLIFYLLEPESDDGLATWNFFDEYLIEKGVQSKSVVFPVFKYFKLEKN